MCNRIWDPSVDWRRSVVAEQVRSRRPAPRGAIHVGGAHRLPSPPPKRVTTRPTFSAAVELRSQC